MSETPKKPENHIVSKDKPLNNLEQHILQVAMTESLDNLASPVAKEILQETLDTVNTERLNSLLRANDKKMGPASPSTHQNSAET